MIFNFTDRKTCIEFADNIGNTQDVKATVLECGKRFLVKLKETELVFESWQWENVECMAIGFGGEVCKEVVR